MKNKSGQSTVITVLITMILTILLCYIVVKTTGYATILQNGIEKSDTTFSKLDKVKSIIDESFLNEYEEKDLIDNAISGMLKGLNDPYAAYYNEKAFESFYTNTNGEYSGVGIYVSYDESKSMPIVLTPIVGSPAAEAGILPGDYIEYVEDTMSVSAEYEEIVDLIQGKIGTFVKIGILRLKENDKYEELEFELERKKIEVNPLTSTVYENNIGYIKITSFDEVSYKNFKAKYDELINENKVKGLIIDVRDNPGGVLDEVVLITDLLVPEGRIVYTVDKAGKEESYDVENGKGDNAQINIPLVVLVNGSSASASEVFAGAIKDYGVGKIVGTKTYGKGVVQTLKYLGDGTYMKLTTSEYFSPNGNKINGLGIEPDIVVELPEDVSSIYSPKYEEDTQLQKAIEQLKSEM